MAKRSLLVIIPCLNEEITIADVISRLPRTIDGIDTIDVVVVDDGCTDATADIAQKNGAMVLSHPTNRGVGAAFRTGLKHARLYNYDYVVNIDGDGQFRPESITDILAPILAGTADMVTASRFKDPDLIPVMPAIKKWGNFRISGLISFLTRRKLYDVSCGYRAYTREVVRSFNLLGNFTYTHEALLQAAFKGFRIEEVPIEVLGVREFGESRVAGNLWLYGKQSLSIIVSNFRDHRPLIAFGSISLLLFVLGAGLAGFFLYHRITTGSFEPHIWAGFSAAFLLGLSCITLLFCQIALMFQRMHAMAQQETEMLLDTLELIRREK